MQTGNTGCSVVSAMSEDCGTEARQCAYCGGEIGEQYLVWDVPEVTSADDPERTGYALRYYLCSDACKTRAVRGETPYGGPDHINIEENA